MSKRSSSSKLFFYDLHGGGAKVQVMADARYFILFHSSLNLYAYITFDVAVFFFSWLINLWNFMFLDYLNSHYAFFTSEFYVMDIILTINYSK